MDGVRTQARAEFDERQQFGLPINGSLTVFELVGGKEWVEPVVENVVSRDLIGRLNRKYHGVRNSVPSFQVVRIDRHMDGKMHITKKVFFELFYEFNLDPFVLHMLHRESYGYQQIPSDEANGDGRKTDTFYIKTISSLIAWTCDADSKRTRAIFIPRLTDSVRDASSIFNSFTVAATHQRGLVGAPWLPRFIALLELSKWMDGILDGQLQTIREAETLTEHGCWKSWDRSRSRPRVDDPSDASGKIGFSLSALANVMRHVQIAASLGAGKDVAGGRDYSYIHNTPDVPAPTLVEAQNAISLVLEQINCRRMDAEYLEQRARSQLSVVSAARSIQLPTMDSTIY
jgi:hypothetical protein